MRDRIDLSNVSDEDLFEEAQRRVQERPLKVFHFGAPIVKASDLTVRFNEGQACEEEVKGVFIAQE